MVSRAVHQSLGVVADFISSFDSRKFAFPELMEIRTHNKKGERYPEKQIKKKIDKDEKTLFGGYPWAVDKKSIILEKVAELEPQVKWIYNRNNVLAKESYDLSDSVACVLGYMNKTGEWLPKDR